MKLTIAVVFILMSLCVIANEEVYPPLTTETLIGAWEALPYQNPPTLWHMEINRTGASYLVQITVGTPCIVRRLISSEVRDGYTRLHFDKAESKDFPGVSFSDIWINGSGTGVANAGTLEWTGGYNPPQPSKPAIVFIKGNWTRDVARASEIAEKAIKEQTVR